MKQIVVTLLLLVSMAFAMPVASQAQNKQADVKTEIAVTDSARIDSIVQARVSELVKKEAKKWKKQMQWEGDPLFNGKDLVIPIIAMLLIFGAPIALVGVVFYFRYKNKRARYEVMKQALEHGHNLPPELAKGMCEVTETANSRDMWWQKGVKMFFIGLGLAIFLGIMMGYRMSSIGFLLMCIGVGEIVVGWFPSAAKVKTLFNKEEEACAPQASRQAQQTMADAESVRPQTEKVTEPTAASTATEEVATAAPQTEDNAETNTNQEETKE